MSPRRWVPALVAVDAVLVAAVLVVVLVTLPRNGSPALVTPLGGASATSSAPATGRGAPAATPSPGPPRFRLPSGNIACDLAEQGVTCTVASATFTPPPVEGCTGTVGHTVVLDANGVAVPCVDGPPPGVAGDDVPTLSYGATSTVGRYSCTSATDGVTCRDTTTGAGFRLARASLATLP